MSKLTTNTINLQSILETINNLPDAGIKLPTLTNPGTSDDLLLDKQLIDSNGNVIEGTIPTKTASDLTVNEATVIVPQGYYSTDVNKTVATTPQAIPTIVVERNGLITATAFQAAGYVSAGRETDTYQLTTQAATTITPTKSVQTAVEIYNYITTSDATAEANEIMNGETAYVNGSKVTGTFTIDEELTTQDDLIAQIQNAVNNLPEIEEEVSVLQDKTVTPTASSQTIIADSGYDGLNSVTINGDENLVAENIVSGVSIFGVEGNASSGNDRDYVDVYNSDTNDEIMILINGTTCHPDTTTKILISDRSDYASFILHQFAGGTIDDIYITYEYEGEDGEIITEESHAVWTDDNGILYGFIYLSYDSNIILHIVYS